MSIDFSDIEFKEVWQDQKSMPSSIDFWDSIFEQSTFNTQKRSKQVVYHVFSGKEIIGLSTAEEVALHNFENNTFFNFRMLIHPNYRIPGLADTLAVKTLNFLEELHLNIETSAIGVITLIENKRILENKTTVFYPATNLMFAGYTNKGAQIRLKYFQGARI
ncbi:MAG: hypothetical protein RLO81_10545 [Fulvivirga sp.]|uniref:hypothetical protein n=1 Tax=Fulvivirga sp. TaxID=1931237 RepID=UPI0032EC6630